MGCLVGKRTRFYSAEAFDGWFEWTKTLLELYTTEKHFVVDNLYRASFLNMQKWILGQNFKGSEIIMRNLLLDAMLSAGKKSKGSDSYVPWMLWNDLKITPARYTSSQYLEATLSKTHNSEAKELFRRIYELAGPLTKINLRSSLERKVVIRYRNSFEFKLQLDPQFHRVIGHVDSIELANPIVIMIEGAPETVGEINSLLQRNHENGRPVILIARNFTEEISATLATNWIRGSLTVVPMLYGTDLDTINLAADMCAITKGELISAHFGDIIASSVLNEDKWGTVDRMMWKDGRLSLFKNVNVDRHIGALVKKSIKAEEQDLKDLINNRILSLSNDALEISIPKDNSFLLEELEGLLQHYNAFVLSGLVDSPIGPIPHCFAAAAKDSADSLRAEILNIGGFLVGVEDEMVVG